MGGNRRPPKSGQRKLRESVEKAIDAEARKQAQKAATK
jgi:hypothetical protein